ncbi:MAG: phage replisome organizer N-terminal domain-containing protein, partial [Clostridiales bacterium]|nr:phage replisome organizer N-terminal domain-containing protein [Clostridiales bacterium]
MSEKRYYWLKLQKDFFKRHDIKYIETLPNGREITHFYLKLMVESVDHEGELRFSPELPYSEAMLASVTDTPTDIVEAGMAVLKELGLVKIDEDGTIVLPKVVKMIDSAADTDEARRAKRYRERKKAERDETSQENVTGVTDNVTNSHESKSKSKSK